MTDFPGKLFDFYVSSFSFYLQFFQFLAILLFVLNHLEKGGRVFPEHFKF